MNAFLLRAFSSVKEEFYMCQLSSCNIACPGHPDDLKTSYILQPDPLIYYAVVNILYLKMLFSIQSATINDIIIIYSRFDLNDLIRFTLTVRKNYRNVPYHNWDHAFSVAHAAYTVVKTTKNNFTPYEVIVCLYLSIF